MSKSYQYFAKKRCSHRFFEVSTLCKCKQPNNYVTCKTCLWFAGETRKKQKGKEKEKEKEKN